MARRLESDLKFENQKQLSLYLKVFIGENDSNSSTWNKMPWQGEHPARETVIKDQLLNFDLEGEHAVKDSEK